MKERKIWDRLCRYFIYFMLYSILGWCYEVFLEVVVYRWGFSNRGVLFGPYCPVYGFGALFFLILLYPMLKKSDAKKILYIPVIFLSCMIIATALELFTSYILEYLTGGWPWQTYVDYKINFQGRIALSPSLRFGLGGVIFLYLVQPVFERICDALDTSRVNKIALVMMILLAVDCICTVCFR